MADYWFESGTPTFLIRQMQHFKTDITSLDTLEVLEQIDQKGYAFAYQTEGRQVVKVGVKFNADTRVPEDWVIV